MKNTAERFSKFKSLTLTLLSLCLLAACQGGGFKKPLEEQMRPGTSAEPQVILEQRKVETQVYGNSKVTANLETQAERESFWDDMMGKDPTYTEEQLADDAEEHYQNNLQNQREEEERQNSQNQRDSDHQSDQNTGDQDESEQTATEQSPPPPVVNPPVPNVSPSPKPEAQTSPRPTTPKPPEPVKPPASPAASNPNDDFCDDLNVAKGRGEADLSGLYNDDSKLAKTMPSEKLLKLSSNAKKNKFVCVLLPIVIRMEEQVYRQRLEVLRLKKKEASSTGLSIEDKNWLSEIKKSYYLDPKASYADLLKRVDIIPLPMILAQAALESGWGTGKMVRDLNNLFGLHQGDKSQPCKRGYDTRNACVRQFNTIGDSVSAFIRLLNTGKYYVKFRDLRAQLRQNKQALDSMRLLASMPAYNENPKKYLKEVNEIMNRSNRFGQFNFDEEKVQAETHP